MNNINRLSYNNETRNFGFWDTLAELARDKHQVYVMADPLKHVIMEFHQNGSLGLRLMDYVEQVQQKMGLNFTIKRKFILDDKYPKDKVNYEKFRQTLFEWFA